MSVPAVLPPADVSASASMDLATARTVAQRVRARVGAAVLGRAAVVDQVVMALLADGHVLLEDLPGSGKTTLAKALGNALTDDRALDSRGHIEGFRRIQFTPDLLPSDITGTTVFEPGTGAFVFKPGPLFSHVVLADEINRTSPKVQAAMLEAMAEKQVTVDNRTYPLDALFFVLATQNPLDLAGTYPLPVAQLDRFLFKIRMAALDRTSELEVLRSIHRRREGAAEAALPTVSRSEVLAARAAMETGVHVAPAIHDTLVDIAAALRRDPRVLSGVSTRSLVLALPALQAHALLGDRDFVRPSDLQAVLPLVFNHRLELGAGSTDAFAVVAESMRGPLDRLSRSLLGS